jgi:glycine/D-amino acid oxidase-like deaminating enzyme
MLIEPPKYLNAMLRDFQIAGGRIVVRELKSKQDIAALAEPAVINCTGLGSRELVGDNQLIPIKGQLTVLLPQPEIDYTVLADHYYMFPRRDGILLGGTFEREQWDLSPDREAEKRVIEAHQRIFAPLLA